MKPILIWGYNKILKDKGYKRKQINEIFTKIDKGELTEDYIFDCQRLK